MMNRLSANECNNLAFALAKYGFSKLAPGVATNPSNSLVADILAEAHDKGYDVQSIIESTMLVMERDYGVFLSDADFDRLLAHCHKVAVVFMRQPEHVRSDLGQDAAYFARPTRH